MTAGVRDGVSQKKVCDILGLSARTIQRWAERPGEEDRRHGPTTRPSNKLSAEESAMVLTVATSKEFADKSPHQIVPTLADRNEYVGSESTFYRILKANKMSAHRGSTAPRNLVRPRAYETDRPGQLFTWDITYLRSGVRGHYFYLYMFLDVYSRKIMGWEVHDNESMLHSSQLLERICCKETINPRNLVVHSDNGSPMKGATMQATMQRLGITPSFSRPSVSDDNPFSESLFKTLKYCPQYPSDPFLTIEFARSWVEEFVVWYNEVHYHSAISFTTPSSRHEGLDGEILSRRRDTYKRAQERNPERWSGNTRKWEKVEKVRLNWLKDDSDCDRNGNILSVS